MISLESISDTEMKKRNFTLADHIDYSISSEEDEKPYIHHKTTEEEEKNTQD